ncbi:MAG: cryptochrome/photolyase family protein [Hyphomicrobiaceae bacterium]|nr:cryptochrome/photolyase family protein [Hyphomicrobiaceae bacterium]
MANTPSSSNGALLLPVLGDQLTPTLASLAAGERSRDVVLMMEVADETTYVRHHKKKIVLILSAMRHFAEELRAAGWQVDYVRLDDPQNTGSFDGEIARAARRHAVRRIVLTEPGEYRVECLLRGIAARTGLAVEILPDTRFLCSRKSFAGWAKGRKLLRMEDFYRAMRKRTGLLMDGDKPVGGTWNLDKENRKPAQRDLMMPRPPRFAPDAMTREVMDVVRTRFDNHFGDLEPFWFPVTRTDAATAQRAFIDSALASFGDFQDAMLTGEPFLYHSVLAPALNIGLIDPLTLCRDVEAAWRAGRVPLNAAEGFIRQIIGWREYVRGIYWMTMPDYLDHNALEARRALPDFYWTGETDMACLAHAIGQTKAEAYAHHIQRLMVTGNFALLAGVDPKAVHEWYLMVYADAFEWVELPNTLGMSQYADGGFLGSKPYAASANYISKMSDYCRGCRFDPKARTGPRACPFNFLYWDFIGRNEARLSDNQRMAMIYASWRKMPAADKLAISEAARGFLDRVAPLPE